MRHVIRKGEMRNAYKILVGRHELPVTSAVQGTSNTFIDLVIYAILMTECQSV
jgi:hypothetical protein